MAESSSNFKKYLRFSTIGLEMGLAVLAGLFAGQYLDNRFGTEPWLLLLFMLMGVTAAFRNLFRLLKGMNQGQTGGRGRSGDSDE